MDSQNNFDANNLFSTGLEPNLHPLLASTTVFPGIPTTTSPSSLYTPVEYLPIYHAPLSLAATNNLTSIPVIQPIASGISLSNLFATAVNQDPLRQLGTPVKIYRAPLAAGLLGKRAGDEARISLPSGSLDVVIMGIDTAELD